MDTTVLQRKLAEQRHLLPSQQELLNRLLFQLAFNDFQNIGLVGAKGSGKSTLALALAELFSEQANVALLTAPLPEQELEGQLLQQWFGQRNADSSLSKTKLSEQMATTASGALPLLLIVDNFSQLNAGARQKLLQLDCLGLFMLAQPSTDMALNLSINLPTLQDAGQILKDEPLDPLAVAERFAASAGNMHRLHTTIIKPEERKTHSAAFWLLPSAIILLVLAAGISWLLPTTSDSAAPEPHSPMVLPPDSPEPTDSPELTDSPEPINRPEPADRPQLTDNTQLATTIEQSDIAKFADSSEMTATSELSTSTELAVLPESTVSPDLDTNVVVPVAAAEPLYQEQQLLALPPELRVLQLAVLSSETALDRFVQAYPGTDIAVYQRSWQGQLQWVILTKNHYADGSGARLARASLAEPLRAAGPFVKPVAAVQQEIKALARLRAEPVAQE